MSARAPHSMQARGVATTDVVGGSTRLDAVDAMRVVALFFVVIIHTAPFSTASSPIGLALDAATVLNQAARFAVPFFFVVSGYFWAARVARGSDPWTSSYVTLKKLAWLFFAWSAIYLLPFNLFDDLQYGAWGPVKRIYWNLREGARHPLQVMLEGTKVHLWFLPALMSCVVISALALKFVHCRWLVILAVCLFVMGLVGKAYAETPLGWPLGFNTRNGPFFGLIFFVTGYGLQRSARRENWLSLGMVMTGVGLVATFIELSLLHRLWGVRMDHDFVLSTYIFGVGVSLLALANPIWLRNRFAVVAGSMTLGVYASHLVFVDLLVPLDRMLKSDVAWSFAQPLVVFLLSFGLVWLLSRSSSTRGLVI